MYNPCLTSLRAQSGAAHSSQKLLIQLQSPFPCPCSIQPYNDTTTTPSFMFTLRLTSRLTLCLSASPSARRPRCTTAGAGTRLSAGLHSHPSILHHLHDACGAQLRVGDTSFGGSPLPPFNTLPLLSHAHRSSGHTPIGQVDLSTTGPLRCCFEPGFSRAYATPAPPPRHR